MKTVPNEHISDAQIIHICSGSLFDGTALSPQIKITPLKNWIDNILFVDFVIVSLKFGPI